MVICCELACLATPRARCLDLPSNDPTIYERGSDIPADRQTVCTGTARFPKWIAVFTLSNCDDFLEMLQTGDIFGVLDL